MLQGPLESPNGTPDVSSFEFSDMHLQPGDRLQIHCPTHPGQARQIVRLVGFVENMSLLVTSPLPRQGLPEFLENEIVVIRAFSRNNAYAFKCTTSRICRAPFAYMHLSFPDRISGSVVRKSMRVKTGFEASVTVREDGSQHTAVVENVSATGALLTLDKALGAKDSALSVGFEITVHDVTTRLEIEALILSVRADDKGNHHHGIEFQELPPNERMILRSLIYQQMIENPRSMV